MASDSWKTRCGCDLKEWFRVTRLSVGEAAWSPSAPPLAAFCSARGLLEGLVSVAAALRATPQQEAKLVNLATEQHCGDQQPSLGVAPHW